MRKTTAFIVSLLLIALAAAPAQAGHSHGCGKISNGKFRVFASNKGPQCDFARKWAKRYIRNKSKPRGWGCSNNVSRKVKFHCHRGEKFYYAQRT